MWLIPFSFPLGILLLTPFFQFNPSNLIYAFPVIMEMMWSQYLYYCNLLQLQFHVTNLKIVG